MREIRTCGSEGGETQQGVFPTLIHGWCSSPRTDREVSGVFMKKPWLSVELLSQGFECMVFRLV